MGGIGIFVTNSEGDLQLWIIHGIQKYTGNVTSSSPVDNLNFGYVGDIDEAIGKLVTFNTDTCMITAETNVPTVAHHKVILKGDPMLDFLPPSEDATA